MSQVKILLIGDTNIGKTSLVKRFSTGSFQTYLNPTQGVDFIFKEIKLADEQQSRVKVQIWDSAGHERFRNLIQTWFKGVHGICIVYDVTNKESFQHVDYWQEQIDLHGPVGCQKVLVGSKCDCSDAPRQVSTKEGQKKADKLGMTFLEVSAKDNIQVDEMFHRIAKLSYDWTMDNSYYTSNESLSSKWSKLSINKSHSFDEDHPKPVQCAATSRRSFAPFLSSCANNAPSTPTQQKSGTSSAVTSPATGTASLSSLLKPAPINVPPRPPSPEDGTTSSSSSSSTQQVSSLLSPKKSFHEQQEASWDGSFNKSPTARSVASRTPTAKSKHSTPDLTSEMIKMPPCPSFADKEKFERHWQEVQWHNDNQCHICAKSLATIREGMKSALGMYNYCRMCGHNVCQKCAVEKKMLASCGYRDSPQMVCDVCAGKHFAQNVVNARNRGVVLAVHDGSWSAISTNLNTIGFAFSNDIVLTSTTASYLKGSCQSGPVLCKRYHADMLECGQVMLAVREVKILRSISHLHIIDLIHTNIEPHTPDTFGLKSAPYLLTPYCPEGTLRQVLERQWRKESQRSVFDWLWCVRALLQVLDTMRFLQQHGIFYNSLTSEHILVVQNSVTCCRQQAEVPLIKFMDFTNAWLSKEEVNFTYPPPTHRAPELWQGAVADVSMQSEIFSFAMLIAEMLLVSKEKFLFNYPSGGHDVEQALGEFILQGIRPNLMEFKWSLIGKELKALAEKAWVEDERLRGSLDDLENKLRSVQATLDLARMLIEVHNTEGRPIRIELESFAGHWEVVQTFGPGPFEERCHIDSPVFASPEHSLPRHFMSAWDQLREAIGYECFSSTGGGGSPAVLVEKLDSADFAVHAEDESWSQIQQLRITGKAMIYTKGDYNNDVLTVHDITLCTDRIRQLRFDRNPTEKCLLTKKSRMW